MSGTQRGGQRGLGAILLAVGVLLMLMRQLNLDFGAYVTLMVGLVFLSLHFLGRQDWAIYPGAFATFTGVPLALASSGTANMAFWWPLFVLGPGLAFFLIAAVNRENRWALVPGSIISSVALVFFAANSDLLSWNQLAYLERWWPIGLIVAGIAILLRRRPIN